MRDERDTALFWIAAGLACVALCLGGLFAVGNSDTYGHLAQGRQIFELGRVPLFDSFSIWKPHPVRWWNYEWLSDVVGFGVYRSFGAEGLLGLKLFVLVATGLLLVLLAYLFGGARSALACCVLLVIAIPAIRFRLTERPHVVAVPFAAAYCIGLSYLMRAWGAGRTRVDAIWIAALFAMHVLWVNLHGSHLLGLGITLAYLGVGVVTREKVRAIAVVFGLQLLASCISPYGPSIVIDAVDHMLDPTYRKLVSEWEPWRATDPLWYLLAPILQTLLLALLLRFLWRRGAAARALLAISCVLALLSFRSFRFLGEYLLLSAPVLGIAIGAALSKVALHRVMVGACIALAGCVVIVPWGAAQLPPFQALGHGEDLSRVPAASGQWLAEHAKNPRILAPLEDSWFLMFAVPQGRFVVDGRVPFYGPEHVHRVQQATTQPALLDATLQHYDVNAVVVQYTARAYRPMLERLRTRRDWKLTALEDRFAVFVRKDIALLEGAQAPALLLPPTYDAHWLLSTPALPTPALLAELATLPNHENARGYRAWVHGMLVLRPFFRDGNKDGLRPPQNAGEVATLRRARAWLRRAAQGAEQVPSVHAYHALAATAVCALDEAELAMQEASREGQSRETLLGTQEIALRRGQTQQVTAFLQAAEATPGAEGDRWLAALREQLRNPVRCP